jgi:hypothetical protein
MKLELNLESGQGCARNELFPGKNFRAQGHVADSSPGRGEARTEHQATNRLGKDP